MKTFKTRYFLYFKYLLEIIFFLEINSMDKNSKCFIKIFLFI